jgi:RNA polymerase primary sigma factor
VSSEWQQLELPLFCGAKEAEPLRNEGSPSTVTNHKPEDRTIVMRGLPVFFPAYNRKNALLKSPPSRNGTPRLELVPSGRLKPEQAPHNRSASDTKKSDQAGLDTGSDKHFIEPDERTYFEATGRRDLLGIYLAEINKIPRLTREQEVDLGKQFEAAQKETTAALAGYPNAVRDILQMFDRYEAGERALSSVILVRLELAPENVGDELSDSKILQEPFDDGAVDTIFERGPDPKVIKVQIEELRGAYEQLCRLADDIGIETIGQARRRLQSCFARFQFKPSLIRKHVKQLQAVVDRIQQHEATIRACCIDKAGMSEAVFTRLFAGNEANQGWLFDLFVANDGDSGKLENEIDQILAMQKRLRRIEHETGLSIQEIKAVEQRARQAQAEADRIKHRFIEANLRLVVWIAGRYRWLENAGLDHTDLIQEGNIGLMTAVERYNYRIQFKFSTMAVHWIRQAITRAIGQQSRLIRVPNHVFDQINRLRSAYRKWMQDNGREPTPAKLSELSELPLDQVERLLAVDREPLSLQSSLGGEDNLELIGTVEDVGAPSPLVETIDRCMRRHIDEALAALTERERTVLRMRFGIDMTDEYTLEKIGRQFNVIKQRAYQLESKALRKLRHPNRAAKLQDFI